MKILIAQTCYRCHERLTNKIGRDLMLNIISFLQRLHRLNLIARGGARNMQKNVQESSQL
jgi:hypothetical protein